MKKQYVIFTGADWGWAVANEINATRGGDFPVFGRMHGAKRIDVARILAEHPDDEPRYAFFLNWSWMVPPVTTALYECVNFHCTPLPYGRGGAPIENMILREHTETVMTAHRMVEEVDAGPIYARHSELISLAGTKDEILARFVKPVTQMIRWIIEAEPTPVPQTGEVTHFKRLPKAVYEACWEGRK